jgi:DNA helicase-2/ATP-dependent DNA helicase PcrA
MSGCEGFAAWLKPVPALADAPIGHAGHLGPDAARVDVVDRYRGLPGRRGRAVGADDVLDVDVIEVAARVRVAVELTELGPVQVTLRWVVEHDAPRGTPCRRTDRPRCTRPPPRDATTTPEEAAAGARAASSGENRVAARFRSRRQRGVRRPPQNPARLAPRRRLSRATVSHGLNPAQQAAVDHDLGPLLVLAGAGSGKTRVVTTRVGRLIQQGVPARAILAMTFTNKAAAEMHERVTSIVGSRIAKDLTVSTFHRFGLKVLGEETRALGLRGTKFAIFDQADCSGVIREILRTVNSGRAYDVGAILGRISNAKNAFWTAEDWEKHSLSGKADVVDEYDEISCLVYPKYLAAMKSFQAFDFDDLICEVVNLWRRRPDVLEKWRERYRYIIVDEYQDTNHAQLELVRLLGGGHRNVCVVGDDDQSIYAWRGADVRNILDFESHFVGAKVVKLEENYRSKAAILNVANAVLAKSGARRHGKVLRPTLPGGDPVEVVVCTDPEVEAAFVGDLVRAAVDNGMRPKDFAVLYRSNLQSGPIESALKERQIPLRMIGGTQFYERKEVKDLVAYLRVAIDPHDEMSLRRIINYPSRGIGDVAVTKLGYYATAHDHHLWTAVTHAQAIDDLAPAAVEGCRQLVQIIEGIRARFARGETGGVVARAVCGDIGLKEDIQAGATSAPAAARRWANVEGLLGVFQRRDDRGLGDRASFADFLRILSLREEGEEEDATDRVTLTTMHGAKGLEWKQVFIVGLEEGLLPHARTQTERATDAPPAPASGKRGKATTSEEDVRASNEASLAASDAATSDSIEEERRLFYVAVTRAREKLYLCRTKTRAMRGKVLPRVPSRFLLDVPPELVTEREQLAVAAPKLDQVKSGASGVLAALLGNLGGAPAGGPPVRRRP